VVLALHLDDERAALPRDPALAGGTYGQVVLGEHRPRAARGGVVSLAPFNAAARGLGVVTVYEDEDHTVREMLFARQVGDSVYMPLVVPLLALQQGLGRGDVAYVGDARRVQIGERRVPLTERDTLLLNFQRAAGDVPDGVGGGRGEGAGRPAELVRGKIALIGVTYFGHDTTRTPFGGGSRGSSCTRRRSTRSSPATRVQRVSALFDALACLLSGLLVVVLFASAARAGARVAGVLRGRVRRRAAAWLLFTRMHLWHGLVWPLGTVAGGRRRRCWRWPTSARRCSGSACAGPSPLPRRRVLEELLADPHLLDLGGARRELTVLFSDIRDFTGLSERLSPEELVALLNVYLTPMTEEVLVRGGYLDKYIGDAVMAVYGAPVPKQNHAALALSTAVAMSSALAKLQPQLRSEASTCASAWGSTPATWWSATWARASASTTRWSATR
jgi:adenylate cyclase